MCSKTYLPPVLENMCWVMCRHTATTSPLSAAFSLLPTLTTAITGHGTISNTILYNIQSRILIYVTIIHHEVVQKFKRAETGDYL